MQNLNDLIVKLAETLGETPVHGVSVTRVDGHLHGVIYVDAEGDVDAAFARFPGSARAEAPVEVLSRVAPGAVMRWRDAYVDVLGVRVLIMSPHRVHDPSRVDVEPAGAASRDR